MRLKSLLWKNGFWQGFSRSVLRHSKTKKTEVVFIFIMFGNFCFFHWMV